MQYHMVVTQIKDEKAKDQFNFTQKLAILNELKRTHHLIFSNTILLKSLSQFITAIPYNSGL